MLTRRQYSVSAEEKQICYVARLDQEVVLVRDILIHCLKAAFRKIDCGVSADRVRYAEWLS